MTMAVRSLGKFSILLLLFLAAAPATLFADHAVNINTADKATLMTLTGIGETKGQAIIDYRTTNGPFDTIEEIQDVSGIGPSTFAGIKDHIVVSGGSPQQSQAQEGAQEASTSTASVPAPGGSFAVEPQLVAHAGDDRSVIVGADTSFAGKAFKKDGTPIGPSGVRFLWNFGDGKTVEGAQVMHRFAHPGRYTVTLDVSADVHAASDRVIVTAREATLTLAALEDGSAVIENGSAYELDLSFWFVRQGDRHFAIPKDTVVLVEERIIIPPDSLGFTVATGWQLLYPNGSIAASAPPPKPEIIHEKVTAVLTPAPKSQVLYKESAEAEPPTTVSQEVGNEALPTSVGQSAGVAATSPGLMGPWLYGLIALISLGAVGAFFASRFTRSEWVVAEEES